MNPRKKRIASLFLLPGCDMSCLFCASEPDFSVMSFEQAVALLNELRDAGIDNVVFGGGEPFLWPHGLPRLSEEAAIRGFLVQVCTNGVSLPSGFARLATVDRYILPLESMNAGLHDRLRRRRGGHHRLVLERIEALAGAGRELTISTVVTGGNLDHLDGIADYLAGLARRGVRVHAWHLYRFLPVGRHGRRNAEDLGVAFEDYRAACRRMKGRDDLGFPVYRRADMLRSSTVEFYWYEEGRLRTGSGGASAAG